MLKEQEKYTIRKLISEYQKYLSSKKKNIGPLLNAAREYCLDKINKYGNFVCPRGKRTKISKLCAEIIGEVNETNSKIAKKLLENM